MSNDKNGKSVEELADEDLDKVAGGLTLEEFLKYENYVCAFKVRNNCSGCGNELEDSCLLWLGDEEIYNMFCGNPDAICQLYKM